MVTVSGRGDNPNYNCRIMKYMKMTGHQAQRQSLNKYSRKMWQIHNHSNASVISHTPFKHIQTRSTITHKNQQRQVRLSCQSSQKFSGILSLCFWKSSSTGVVNAIRHLCQKFLACFFSEHSRVAASDLSKSQKWLLLSSSWILFDTMFDARLFGKEFWKTF